MGDFRESHSCPKPKAFFTLLQDEADPMSLRSPNLEDFGGATCRAYQRTLWRNCRGPAEGTIVGPFTFGAMGVGGGWGGLGMLITKREEFQISPVEPGDNDDKRYEKAALLLLLPLPRA